TLPPVHLEKSTCLRRAQNNQLGRCPPRLARERARAPRAPARDHAPVALYTNYCGTAAPVAHGGHGHRQVFGSPVPHDAGSLGQGMLPGQYCPAEQNVGLHAGPGGYCDGTCTTGGPERRIARWSRRVLRRHLIARWSRRVLRRHLHHGDVLGRRHNLGLRRHLQRGSAGAWAQAGVRLPRAARRRVTGARDVARAVLPSRAERRIARWSRRVLRRHLHHGGVLGRQQTLDPRRHLQRGSAILLLLCVRSHGSPSGGLGRAGEGEQRQGEAGGGHPGNGRSSRGERMAGEGWAVVNGRPLLRP
ncbi:unnamed protein product, partial [Prorocentrum cordatum]